MEKHQKFEFAYLSTAEEWLGQFPITVVRLSDRKKGANSTSKCNTAQTSWHRAFPIQCKTQDSVIKGFASNLKCPRLAKSLRFQCFRCCTSKLNSRGFKVEASGLFDSFYAPTLEAAEQRVLELIKGFPLDVSFRNLELGDQWASIEAEYEEACLDVALDRLRRAWERAEDEDED
jgi:hypothetical protein